MSTIFTVGFVNPKWKAKGFIDKITTRSNVHYQKETYVDRNAKTPVRSLFIQKELSVQPECSGTKL